MRCNLGFCGDVIKGGMRKEQNMENKIIHHNYADVMLWIIKVHIREIKEFANFGQIP